MPPCPAVPLRERGGADLFWLRAPSSRECASQNSSTRSSDPLDVAAVSFTDAGRNSGQTYSIVVLKIDREDQHLRLQCLINFKWWKIKLAPQLHGLDGSSINQKREAYPYRGAPISAGTARSTRSRRSSRPTTHPPGTAQPVVPPCLSPLQIPPCLGESRGKRAERAPPHPAAVSLGAPPVPPALLPQQRTVSTPCHN